MLVLQLQIRKKKVCGIVAPPISSPVPGATLVNGDVLSGQSRLSVPKVPLLQLKGLVQLEVRIPPGKNEDDQR